MSGERPTGFMGPVDLTRGRGEKGRGSEHCGIIDTDELAFLFWAWAMCRLIE